MFFLLRFSQRMDAFKRGSRNVKNAFKNVYTQESFQIFIRRIGNLCYTLHYKFVPAASVFEVINICIKDRLCAFYSDEINLIFLKLYCYRTMFVNSLFNTGESVVNLGYG